jgi:TolB-like protein/Flp pilus assembly protein TadD/predicted Ser/Thr protein kinase
MLGADNVLSHYRLLEPLGAGGMGVVWRARDAQLGREVALKVLFDAVSHDPDQLAMLEAEARTLAALNHSNIVTVYSVEEADGLRFITMELVDGQTLGAALPAGGFPLDRLLDLALQIAAAIDAAHERGITHRDLKPGNIMLARDGRVKVVDFGLARMELRDTGAPTGEVSTADLAAAAGAPKIGTLSYMSPERMQGAADDRRSDIFSFGILLYEMATGHRPFEGPDAMAVIRSLLTERPRPPAAWRPGLPPPLGRLIMQCLEKEPGRRVQSVSEIRNTLEGLRAGTHVPRAHQAIAVLPFDDVSQARDQGYLCEGIAEEILIALARVPGLRVAPRTATFPLKAAGIGSLDAAARVNADAVLDGSVRRSADRLRVSVELVDARDGRCIWAAVYEREMCDVFCIQDDIAAQVVEALRIRLSDEDAVALSRTHTPAIDAYDYYLRGRQLYYQYNRKGIELARQLFTHAVGLDPSYARGYAGIADCCMFVYLYVQRDAAHLACALDSAQRALALDPTLAEAHASLGVALSLSGRHAEADDEFTAAIRLDPGLFEAHYFAARDAFVQGHLDEAVRHYTEAARSRPDDYQSPLLMAQSCEDLGRHADALEARRRGVALAERHLAINPHDVRALYMGANGLVALGEREKGLTWARRALEFEPDESMVLYNVACVYSMAGDTEGAVDSLERAVAAGLTQRGWLEHDSNLDAIRGDPRVQALIQRLP